MYFLKNDKFSKREPKNMLIFSNMSCLLDLRGKYSCMSSRMCNLKCSHLLVFCHVYYFFCCCCFFASKPTGWFM